jgi:superfamily II DNA or RNA helicase
VGLNTEGRELASELGDRAILLEGSQSPEEKAEKLEAFIDSDAAVLVTKVRIAGFGMNFQHCARMAFIGMGDSYEQYYQAVRRCWRFGQRRAVCAYIILSEPEKSIYDNVLRKEREATVMQQELVKHVATYERAEIGKIDVGLKYENHNEMRLPDWMRISHENLKSGVR